MDAADGVQGNHEAKAPLLFDEPWKTVGRSQKLRSLSMPGLVAIIYYSVAGGPFGTEDVISAAGPLVGLLGFLLMPAVWSVPEALVAAELSTAFPSNGGYVTWVTAAFGPFWGFLEGFLSWTSGVSDNSIYPVLFCDYLQHVLPSTAGGWPRTVCVITFTLVLSWLNYLGLNIMGWSAVMLAIFTILPFAYLVPVLLPKVELANLLVVPEFHEMDWQKYLMLAMQKGKLCTPWQPVYVLEALLLAMVLVIASYFFPLFVGVGMSSSNAKLEWRRWRSGTLSLVGLEAGGQLVKSWVVVAAAASNIGQFTCEQAANAFQLEGMAESGWLPKCFMHRSCYNTPSVGLGTGLVIILALSSSDFVSIVDLLNGIYCQAQLLEFMAFLQLRRAHPTLPRPFRVPLSSFGGCVAMLFLPMVFCFVLLALPFIRGDWFQIITLTAAPVVGVCLHGTLALCRRRGWLAFAREPPKGVEELLAMQTPMRGSHGEAAAGFFLEPFDLPAAAEDSL